VVRGQPGRPLPHRPASIPTRAIEPHLRAGTACDPVAWNTLRDTGARERPLGRAVEAKNKARRGAGFEEAGKLRDKEKELLAAKRARIARSMSPGVDLFDEVDEEASSRGGCPCGPASPVQAHRGGDASLLRWRTSSTSVIGQEESIRPSRNGPQARRAGLKDPSAPSGSFIFPAVRSGIPICQDPADFLFGDESRSSAGTCPSTWRSTLSAAWSARLPATVRVQELSSSPAVRRSPSAWSCSTRSEKAHPYGFPRSSRSWMMAGSPTPLPLATSSNTVLIMTSNLAPADLLKAHLASAGDFPSATPHEYKVKDALRLTSGPSSSPID